MCFLSRKTSISILPVRNSTVENHELLCSLTNAGQARGVGGMAEHGGRPGHRSHQVSPRPGRPDGEGPRLRARLSAGCPSARGGCGPGSRSRLRARSRLPPPMRGARGRRLTHPMSGAAPAAAPTGPLALAVRPLGCRSLRGTCGGPSAPGSAPAPLHSAGLRGYCRRRQARAGGGWAPGAGRPRSGGARPAPLRSLRNLVAPGRGQRPRTAARSPLASSQPPVSLLTWPGPPPVSTCGHPACPA